MFRKCETRGGPARVATVALLLLVASPVAFAGNTSAPPVAADAAGHSTIGYPASFFASMGLDTAYDMVLRLPGFVFDDGSDVRGLAGAAGNVLIDGDRPASKTDDLTSILQRISSSTVERIDLIRGGAPGIDMQGKTVVANVIRKKAAGFNGVVAVGAYKPVGIPFDPQVRLEGNWDDGSRIIQASLFVARYHDGMQSDGPHEILGPLGQLEDFSAMQNRGTQWQYLGTAAYEAPVLGGKLHLNLTLEDQPYDKYNIDHFEFAGLQVETDHQNPEDLELGQHYERNLSGPWQLELFGLEHLNRSDTFSLFDTSTDHENFSEYDHGGEMIARAILHWRPSDALTVDNGGEFDYNWLNTTTFFTDNGSPIQVPAGDVLVTEKRGEVFSTAVWRPLDTLALETGIRVEASTISSSGDVTLSKTLVFPKPRFVATWTPDALDQLRLRVEREVGQLDFGDFAANAALNSTGVTAGNPNLTPQRDWAFEAAYDRHFWTDGVISLTFRHLALEDVVDRVPVFAPSGVFDEPGNIGNGSENDIVVSFNLPLNRLGLEGAALHGIGTWRFSRVTDPTTGQPRQISLQHPLDAELHFTKEFPKWNVTLGLDSILPYVERDFRFDEIDTTDYGIENTLYVDYRPRPDLTLRLQTDLEQLAFETSRQVFAGPRNTNPLEFTDLQQRRFGPIMFIRLRKTLD